MGSWASLIIDYRGGCGEGGDGFVGAFQIGEVTGEGKGGAERERVGLQDQGGERNDKSGPTLTSSMFPVGFLQRR
ncbi:hypothetical protein ACFX13_002411 [Malus domestica]